MEPQLGVDALWSVLFAWAPHEQAADAPRVHVVHNAGVGVDVVEVPRLLDESGAPKN